MDAARREVLLTARFHFYEIPEKERHGKQIGGRLSGGGVGIGCQRAHRASLAGYSPHWTGRKFKEFPSPFSGSPLSLSWDSHTTECFIAMKKNVVEFFFLVMGTQIWDFVFLN